MREVSEKTPSHGWVARPSHPTMGDPQLGHASPTSVTQGQIKGETRSGSGPHQITRKKKLRYFLPIGPSHIESWLRPWA